MPEFDLIARIRERALNRNDVLLGIGDDCALLNPLLGGMQLAITTDTLNAGVHFPRDTAPVDIGWKAMASNLSDLAAMGATPAWVTLALSLPEADAAFVEQFLDGFLALAGQHEVALIGGDTTRGPLSINVSAYGFVAEDLALRRDGARLGDDIWISGTLGDAAAALWQWRAADADAQTDGEAPAGVDAELRARLDRPVPRIALGRALRGVATACIDLSDGLIADLGHICAASGIGAQIDIDALPASRKLREIFDGEGELRRMLQATGGDDYELCFTAPSVARAAVQAAAEQAQVAVTCIGTMNATGGVRAVTADGTPWIPSSGGWEHFAA